MMEQAIETAPIAYVWIALDGRIEYSNACARDLGLRAGMALDALKQDNGDLFVVNERCLTADARQWPDGIEVWLTDITEQTFLRDALIKAKQPQSKLLQSLRHQVSHAQGHVELVALMLDDSAIISGEKLDALRRYQADIVRAVNELHETLQSAGESRQPPQAGEKIPHVLIIIRESTRAELIMELLKSQAYKVSTFTDRESVERFLTLNDGNITLAILDDPSMEPDTLLAHQSGIKIIQLTERPQEIAQNESLIALASTPLDITELVKTAGQLVNQS